MQGLESARAVFARGQQYSKKAFVRSRGDGRVNKKERETYSESKRKSEAENEKASFFQKKCLLRSDTGRAGMRKVKKKMEKRGERVLCF